MGSQTWVECLVASNVASTAMVAAGPATILPPQAVWTLPQGYLDKIGKTLRITALGVISNIATTPGTLLLTVNFGAVIAWTGSAMQMNSTIKTNVPWKFDWIGTVRTLGTGAAEPTAQIIGIGSFISESIVGSPVPATGGAGMLLEPTVTPVVGTVFDSTSALTVNLMATFSIGGTGNGITTYLYTLESLN